MSLCYKDNQHGGHVKRKAKRTRAATVGATIAASTHLRSANSEWHIPLTDDEASLDSDAYVFSGQGNSIQATQLDASEYDGCDSPLSVSSGQLGKLARFRIRIRSSRTSSQASVDDGSSTASKRSRKNRKSLSSIGNQLIQEATALSDGTRKSLTEAERERLAWDIINREVSEWHNICRSGRPSWWLPTSSWTDSRTRHLDPALLPLVPFPALIGPTSDGTLKTAHCSHGRSVTEGCMTTNDDTQDLVHLIALQLLGACFTLPEEYIASLDPSQFVHGGPSTLSGFPDPQLISSLKMHTNRRSFPSFGHDATNSSPTLFWQTGHGGLSPSESSAHHSRLHKSQLKVCAGHRRRRRVYRQLQVSENSAPDDSQSSRSEAEERYNLHLDELAPARQRHRDCEGSKVSLSFSDAPERNLAISSGATEINGHAHFQSTQSNVAHGNVPPRYPSRYILRPKIRSEPHPVFIQPVKELVVKQWHNIRKRFGQSLTRGCPDPSGTSAQLESQNSPRSVSPGSPQLSSDGKYRRREARDRHDINSDTEDSCRRRDLPRLSTENEAESTKYHDIATPPPFEHADSPRLLCGVGTSKADANEEIPSSVEPTILEGLICSEPPGATLGSRTESGFFLNVVKGKQEQSNTSLFRPRRASARCQRKSMLSEMYTADDSDNVNLSATPTTVTFIAPKESLSSGSVAELSHSIGDTPVASPQPPSSPKLIVSSPNPAGYHGLVTAPSGRPRIERRSTSGTQVFRPGESGVEVDGLPMGPVVGIWDEVNEDGCSQRKGMTYL